MYLHTYIMEIERFQAYMNLDCCNVKKNKFILASALINVISVQFLYEEND